MEKTYKINKIVGGFEAILRATGKVVAEYNHLVKPIKIFDAFNLPLQEYVEAIAASV